MIMILSLLEMDSMLKKYFLFFSTSDFFRPLGNGKTSGGGGGGASSGIRAPPAPRPVPVVTTRAAPAPTRPAVTSKSIQTIEQSKISFSKTNTTTSTKNFSINSSSGCASC